MSFLADPVSVPGLTPLPVGVSAPDFTLRDQNNEVVTLSSFRGGKAVLLVFYPWAFTSICTGELGQIRDRPVNIGGHIRWPEGGHWRGDT